MEDNKTPVTETPDVAKKEEMVEKTFTQEEVNKLIGDTKKDLKSKQEDAIKTAVENAVQTAIDEYDRQAKLTQEEKDKEAKTKHEKELKERELKITLKERKLNALDLLAEKNIPRELVDFVIDEDEKVMNEKIEKLAKTYGESIEKSVSERLKGETPKKLDGNDSSNESALRKAMKLTKKED